MKILVTGGAGFIGSHLVDYLLIEDNQVVVIDNLSLGLESNISKHFENKNFKFYKQDLLNLDSVKEIFKTENFETVFHLAANSDIARSTIDPKVDLDNTFLTTYNVLTAMREFNVKNLIFSSTSAIYGETSEKISENFGPLFPISHYGAGKLASEAFVSSFSENYGFNVWIIRFPNVVGERATHGVILDFINRLKLNPYALTVLGDGMQHKPYLYVKDLVEAIVYIWKNTNEKINVYNVGVDSRTRVKEIAEMVVSQMGLTPEIKYNGGDRGWIGDVPQFNYNLQKVHNIGWHAKYTSNEAVKMAIKAILES